MNMPALEVVGAHKRFGAHTVLRGVDLVVQTGTIVAVLGPSGGGKSTLLRLIAGFERPDEGTIRVAGRQVAGGRDWVPPEERRVGLVPQEGALFPHLDVAGNVAFGLPRGERNARVEEVLELVGLAGMQRQRPQQLSGGQQQRVALARALAPRPSVILLDEPFSSLDATLRGDIRDEVCDVLRAAGATAILVTHDQQEALSVADEVAVLLHGTIAQAAPPVDLYERPVALEIATFVGDAVVIPGAAGGHTAACALGELRLTAPAQGVVTLVIRPEQIELADVGVAGTVLGTSYFGHDGMVRVQLADGQTVSCRSHAHHLPARGARVHVAVASPVLAYES